PARLLLHDVREALVLVRCDHLPRHGLDLGHGVRSLLLEVVGVSALLGAAGLLLLALFGRLLLGGLLLRSFLLGRRVLCGLHAGRLFSGLLRRGLGSGGLGVRLLRER